MFDTGKIQAAAAAAIAAILLTAGTVAAAVGPARAAELEKPLYAAVVLADEANG